MTQWEYKSVIVERTGTKEDFGFTWSYGPWEARMETGSQPLLNSLGDLGKQGWELTGVMPTDLWAEAGRGGGASGGVRGIASLLLFKRPIAGS
jgi:hypothetical protein